MQSSRNREKKRRVFGWAVLALFLIGQGIFPLGGVLRASAATPRILNYQGRLEDSSNNLLGGSSGTNFDFRFSIWNSSTTGSGIRLWPTPDPASTTHRVVNGVFDARIGDTSQGFAALNFDFNTSTLVYLQIQVWNTATLEFETLSPRQPIVSAGFAINADTLDGFTSGTSSNNLLLLDSAGNINLPGGQVRTLNTSSCSGVSALGGGSLCYDTSNDNLFVFNAASSSWVAVGGSSSTGSTLQQAYDIGNVINATSARDIAFNLNRSGTDPNFTVTIATSSSGAFLIRDGNSVAKFSVTTS